MGNKSVFHQTSNRNSGGFINFDDDEGNLAEAEKIKEREAHINERVNKLIFMWNNTQQVEEFEQETDPFVILGVQKRLHNEMNNDFAKNIDDMTRYLSKKDSAMMKKQDGNQLTTCLT